MPTRPARREDLTAHELDGELLIFDSVSSDTHRLNSTALSIWNLCDGTRDIRRIAEALTEVYDVAMEVAIEHVERTCEQLHSLGLLAAVERTPPRSDA